MGKLKNLSILIDEVESDIEYMSKKLGISESEFRQLNYSQCTYGAGLLSRSIMFNLEKCPREIIAKIPSIVEGNKFYYDLSDVIEM